MAKNYNMEIADTIKSFLDKNNWRYSFDSNRGLFRFILNLKGKINSIQYVVDVDELCYTVYAFSSLPADPDDSPQMRKMSEIVCRANYGINGGNFEAEFDCQDAELRYKSFVCCYGIRPTSNMVEISIHCPITMFDRYSKGILVIPFNDMNIAEAIALCEEQPVISSGSIDDEECDEDISQLFEQMQELYNIEEDDSEFEYNEE